MKYYDKFVRGKWCNTIDVEDFIKLNYREYLGNENFLCKTTTKTNLIMEKVNDLLQKELKKKVLDIETSKVSGINSFEPGYICKEDDIVVGLQTDKPLKRIINPYGGIRMVYQELASYGYKFDENIEMYFTKFRKTHNDGVFDAYTDEMKLARHVHLLTGLPDSYGRGRIIGDYRRIALYGTEYLIKCKEEDKRNLSKNMSDDIIRLAEEISMQIKALKELTLMAKSYGFDISVPAQNSKEAVQWTYLGYLAAVKEDNGAAMSLGRVDAFFDIYFERDLKKKAITESMVQEIIDNFVIKLRLVRHLRTPEYDELFSGDPTWVTCSIGGMNKDKSFVTKTSYRIIHTLKNLGSAPEPNITILYSEKLPVNFKKYCAKISIQTDSIQYENDDLMCKIFGNDYAIACCVSAMRVGKDMQFFGARCNLAKALLYAINGGIDENENVKVFDEIPKNNEKILNYKTVLKNFFLVLSKVANLYANTMNVIHYMHDKYAYESVMMSLHDTNVNHFMAYGVAGLSVVVDSLSAIKYAKVKPVRDENGIAVDFIIDGDFPKFGNDDNRVDKIAQEVLDYFYNELKKVKSYKNAKPTMSILTITSNIVYGKNTGSTPDGRKKGQPFAPGANPMHERDKSGAIASLNSVAKIDYQKYALDGISNTFTIIPDSLGNCDNEKVNNLINLLDGYFKKGGHHLNVNVLNKETLIEAMNNPEKYPLLTIRVSGYAVRFNRLTKNQQLEVISRTFHEKM